MKPVRMECSLCAPMKNELRSRAPIRLKANYRLCGKDSIQLRKAYDLTLKLQSQLLGVIYDMETFTMDSSETRIAVDHSYGQNSGEVVILTINEALPPMKRLTEAIEEHWKIMIHEAIDEAARQAPLPYFEKAMVEITIITPRGTNNANVWDTSNRAVNVIINNLKGIFFRDDNIEHMAFSVVGLWGETGVTILRISEFDESMQIVCNSFVREDDRLLED